MHRRFVHSGQYLVITSIKKLRAERVCAIRMVHDARRQYRWPCARVCTFIRVVYSKHVAYPRLVVVNMCSPTNNDTAVGSNHVPSTRAASAEPPWVHSGASAPTQRTQTVR